MRRLRDFVFGTLLVGSVLGGAVAWAVTTKSGPAAALEATLAREGGNGVVLLGNSKVSTDLDLEQLRAALGPDAPTITPANVYGTSAPVWYAVLKNRVYANGHRPSLLVVFAPLETALVTDLPAELARAVLGAQLAEEEPAVTDKVFHGELGPDVRDRLRRLLLPACHPERAAVTPARHVKVPEAPVQHGPESSFLADILALAREHGTRTVVVRAPFAPSRAVQDDVNADEVAAAVAMIQAYGAGWIDLSDGAPEAAFGDGVHMNVAGRRRMTEVLAEALRPVLAGGPLPAQAVAPPARLLVTREGAGPPAFALDVTRGEGCTREATHPLLATLGDSALRAAGFGPISPLVPRQGNAPLRTDPSFRAAGARSPTDCTGMYSTRGDSLEIAAYAQLGETFALVPNPQLPLYGAGGEQAWWVHPGTTLRVSVPPLAAGERVTTSTARFGGTTEPTWSLGDRPLRRGRGTALGGETSIAVTSPPDGPWVLVERVNVGTRVVLGGEAPLHLDLLAGSASYAGPPPALPPMGPGKPTPEGSSQWIDLPPGVPDDEIAFSTSGHGRCAPLEVLRDGFPVDADGSDGLLALPASRGLLLSSRDCAPLGARAEGLSWRLAADRACRAHDGARWLYPGDILTLTTVVQAPLAGTTRSLQLELGGALVGPPDLTATLTIDVRADSEHWASFTLPSSTFHTTPPSVQLPRRRLREDARVEVRMSATSGTTWLVLTSAVLTEPSPAIGADPWRAWTPQ